jgi:hypothetical protein
MASPLHPRALTLHAASLVLILVASMACSGAEVPVATPTPPTAPSQPVQTWSVTVQQDGIDLIFATPDLGVGRQRVAFVLADRNGLIRLPVVHARTYEWVLGNAARPLELGPAPVESVTARFYEFPLGTRGIYVTNLEFTHMGAWVLDVDVPRPDGKVATVQVTFQVEDRPYSVAVGQRPPASRNKTIKDVTSIAELTTGTHRDPELYQTTIADALNSGKPAVVVFASPAFCTNAVCGPQVEVLSELRQRYAGQANFIHIDYYDNPHEVQGDLSRAIVSPILNEWRLGSQEWTFVIRSDGRVSARFENFAPFAELEVALDVALGVPAG